jgi:uncharacterized membrane protein
MATTQRRSSSGKRRSPTAAKKKSPAVSKNGARASKAGGAGKAAAAKARNGAKAMTPSGPGKLARAAAGKAFKAVARRALQSGAGAVRSVTERGTGVSREAIESALSKRLPIQVSIDVAVPISFAWDEWMTFEWMTEGLHRIVEVERDGDQLFGQLAGPRSTDWEADVVDEREEESFAWRSVTGSDCAGLVTFHRLSERLTRIELDLDVLPTNPAEAASLALRIGRRRAESELRRFKAHVEFVNPDVYESDADEEPEEADEPDEYEEDEELDEGEDETEDQ